MRILSTIIVCICLFCALAVDTWIVTLRPVRDIAYYSHVAGTQALQQMIRTDQPSQQNTIQTFVAITEEQLVTAARALRFIPRIAVPMNDAVAVLHAFSSKQRSGQSSKWVVVFLNNNELRPGGGFIGSLGFISVRNFHLERLEIRDVYELDGQIRNHVTPHFAVQTYLHLPSEHIRDSNFEPFFPINAEQILGHLKTIPAFSEEYDGVVGVTVTGFEKVLRTIGPVELSDYQTLLSDRTVARWLDETIERNFFPGSTYKRDVLQTLSTQTLRKLSLLDPARLGLLAVDLLQSRDIVQYSIHTTVQRVFEKYALSGPLISSRRNWLLPVDANVGVNKVNASIQKTQLLMYDLKTGRYRYTANYRNISSHDEYHNFVQFYLPQTAIVQQLSVEQTRVSPVYENVRDSSRVVGSYLVVKPQTTGSISVEFSLPRSPSTMITLLQQTGNSHIPTTVATVTGSSSSLKQFILSGDREITFR